MIHLKEETQGIMELIRGKSMARLKGRKIWENNKFGMK